MRDLGTKLNLPYFRLFLMGVEFNLNSLFNFPVRIQLTLCRAAARGVDDVLWI